MAETFQVLGAELNFLGVDTHYQWDEAEFIILPIPLELTTSYIKGASKGPQALLDASHQVEFFDDELRVETFRCGIATLPFMELCTSKPEEAISLIERRVSEILEAGKRLIVLGGEHTITVGSVRAFKKQYPNLSVLHLDAHADLREDYEGTTYSHACVMARVREICPFVSIGVRSISSEENEKMSKEGLCVYDIHRIRADSEWMENSLADLSEDVYITFDLDVLDPSVMPAVGTPEPGGLGWYDILTFLKMTFKVKKVVGMDMVELAPNAGMEYGVFNAAKLLYRMIGYWAKSK